MWFQMLEAAFKHLGMESPCLVSTACRGDADVYDTCIACQRQLTHKVNKANFMHSCYTTYRRSARQLPGGSRNGVCRGRGCWY